MKKWIPNNKLIKLVVLVAFASAALYFASLFLVLKEITKIENLNKEINAAAAKEEYRTIQSTLQANKEYIESLRQFYIQKGDEIKFIEEIEKAGQEAGVTFEINSIDVKTNQANSFKEDVGVKVSLSGGWDNVILFFDILEKKSFGVSMQNINVRADEKAGSWLGVAEFIIFREK